MIGGWEHYAVVLDRLDGHAILYRDGTEVPSGAVTRSLPTTAWGFGHHSDPAFHQDSWNGLIDDLRIYNRLLLPEAVQELLVVTEPAALGLAAIDC